MARESIFSIVHWVGESPFSLACRMSFRIGVIFVSGKSCGQGEMKARIQRFYVVKDTAFYPLLKYSMYTEQEEQGFKTGLFSEVFISLCAQSVGGLSVLALCYTKATASALWLKPYLKP